MAAYVDCAAIVYRGRPRHHLTADTLEELHAFAALAGVKRCWYHPSNGKPHYDITDDERATALERGAQPVSSREVLLISKRAHAQALTRGNSPLAQAEHTAQLFQKSSCTKQLELI